VLKPSVNRVNARWAEIGTVTEYLTGAMVA
jgi:hypothetical protein